ncbi:serine protease 27-like [Arapaima gigas]
MIKCCFIIETVLFFFKKKNHLFPIGFWTCEAQVCGNPPLTNRIVGGTNAVEGAWPWQVDIQTIPGGHVCGGSIISANWVLSAAHCFPDPSSVSNYILYLGRYQLNGVNQFEVVKRVARVVIPPGYVNEQRGLDIALVQLDSSVAWTDYIQPVCLPDATTLFPSGMYCHVTGWGQVQEEVSLTGAGTLQQVQVPIIDMATCQQMIQVAVNVEILPSMICAGYVQGGKDACQGDSGGPLVCPILNGTWVQAGVVSFGVGCARPNHPGIYTLVSAYTDFIQSNVPDAQLVGRASRSWPSGLAVLVNAVASLLVVVMMLR